MGAWPNFSYIQPELVTKLKSRAGNNKPWNRLDSNNGGVSGLTPWIRVISAVGVNDSKSSNGGLVLQSNYNVDGFETRYGNNTKSGILGMQLDLRTPVEVTRRLSQNEASNTDESLPRGLRPSPVINSVSIDETDIGRKKIRFSIVAYTVEHMEELSKYFLEPGFYVLVEWGWNTDRSRQQWAGYTNDGMITPCEIASHINYKIIKDKRKNSDFEYDAALGLTTTGGISFGDNETYVLDVELTSIGDVAEYMQSHKGSTTSKNSNKNSSLSFDDSSVTSETDPGRSLFKQMFNRLPAANRTLEMKSSIGGRVDSNSVWVDEEDGDGIDNLWRDPSNYINMDSEVIDKAKEAISSNKNKNNSQDNETSSDKPIFSNNSFIRFELAVAILNKYGADLDSNRLSGDGSCPNYKANYTINIDTCICGAFPHMFSTDESKLYIPNTTAPYLGLETLLYNTDTSGDILNYSKLDSRIQNLHPKIGGNITYRGTRAKNGQSTPHAFPSNYRLTPEDNNWSIVDENIQSFEMEKKWWGWLKNLYINFNFFIQTIKTPNYIAKDVLYDLLNGMSGAVNSHWKFQIVSKPRPSRDKNKQNEELHVVDLNFVGTKTIDNDTMYKSTFQTRGTNSPFVSVNFKADTPAAVQNSVLQKRFSNDDTVDTHVDLGTNVPILGSVFSKQQDPVGTIISSIEFRNVSGSGSPSDDPEQTSNYDLIVGNGGVFPKQFRNEVSLPPDNSDRIDDFAVVGTWSDSNALRKVYLIDIGSNKKIKESDILVSTLFGLASVEFEVHGISGFKRGDSMRYLGLPRQFSDPHIYEVTEMQHTVDSSGWKTNIVTKMRPFGLNK